MPMYFTNEDAPYWMEDGKLQELEFARWFQKNYDLIFTDHAFFSKDGRISDESWIKQQIYKELRLYVSSNLRRKVDDLFYLLKLEARVDDLPFDENTIHVQNGTYHMYNGFSPEKQFCRFRLPVNYFPHSPEPENWLNFLNQLLEKEDIDTLQEFMGYCLLPTTRGQKMLIITGQGGEGKSRIGVVMKKLLGNNMSMGSIAKVEASPFARADLEHLLLMVDDDLKMEALSSTNYLKSIITSEVPMDLERKGEQSYQGRLYVRFMAFGNDTLQALHDRSYGFFRRQIILTAKPRPADRVDDPYLVDSFEDELDAIFYWCLAGLYRVWANRYQFTTSRKTEENINRSIANSNNVVAFMASTGYISRDPNRSISSRQLYELYKNWCDDNAVTPLASRSFWTYLSQNAGKYGITYSEKIPIGSGKYARGFVGIFANFHA